MSKRKSKPVQHARQVAIGAAHGTKAGSRQAMGRSRYGTDRPARRMKCSHCPRTRPFDFDALHAVCGTCKVGRWE